MRILPCSLLLCLAACRSGSGARSTSLPGTYVKVIETPYSKACDTLEITRYADGGNIYVLAERDGYTMLRNGQPTGTGHKHAVETAVFNPVTGQLQGLASGRLLAFWPEKCALLPGAGVYQKIKEQ